MLNTDKDKRVFMSFTNYTSIFAHKFENKRLTV